MVAAEGLALFLSADIGREAPSARSLYDERALLATKYGHSYRASSLYLSAD
jgi:hypothetical protein